MITEQRKMSDGGAVEITRFHPSGQPRAVIQFIHGFGEHAGRYVELARCFTENGFAFVMHDQRGHGKTCGKRGAAPSYDCLLTDVEEVRTLIGEWYPGAPVILYGHSMGGNVALNYLLFKNQEHYICAIAGCPWLRLHKPAPKIAIKAAFRIGKIFPNLTVGTGRDLTSILTHDPDIAQAVREDKVYHNRLSFLLFSEVSIHGEMALEHARSLRLPALLLCAEQDKLVSSQAIWEFVDRAEENVKFKHYIGMYHELHNETERRKIFQDVLQFIEALLPREPAEE